MGRETPKTGLGPPGNGGEIVQVTTLTYLTAFASAWQLALAWMLARDRPAGSVRGVAAALFLVNGGVGAAVALASMGVPLARVLPWINVVDAPSGALLLLLATALLRGADGRARGWAREERLAIAAIAAAYTLLAAVVLTEVVPWEAVRVPLAIAPLFAGYALLLVALARRFLFAAGEEDERHAALLLVGLGARPAEFAVYYGAIVPFLPLARDGAWLASVIGGALLLAIVLVLLVSLARAPRRRVRVLVASALAAACVFGALSHSGTEPVGVYLLTQVTLVFVRPAFLAAALLPGRGPRAAGAIAAAVAAYALAKAAIATLLGVPFLALSVADALAGSLVLVALPLALHALDARRVAPPAGGTRAVATRAERLVAFLVASPGASQRDIEAALGIRGRHLAEVVADAERLLARAAGEASTGPFVLAEAVNVKGRKTYRLTPAGADAARRLVAPEAELRAAPGPI